MMLWCGRRDFIPQADAGSADLHPWVEAGAFRTMTPVAGWFSGFRRTAWAGD